MPPRPAALPPPRPPLTPPARRALLFASASGAASGGLGRLLAFGAGFGAGFGRGRLVLGGRLRAAPAPGRRGGGDCQRRRRDDRRRPRVDLEDPEAQNAVGDPQVVVQLVEQRSLGLEAEEAIVGLGSLLDLVGKLAHPPAGVLLERAAGLDPLSRLRRDLFPTLLRDLRIDHQDELVFA